MYTLHLSAAISKSILLFAPSASRPTTIQYKGDPKPFLLILTADKLGCVSFENAELGGEEREHFDLHDDKLNHSLEEQGEGEELDDAAHLTAFGRQKNRWPVSRVRTLRFQESAMNRKKLYDCTYFRGRNTAVSTVNEHAVAEENLNPSPTQSMAVLERRYGTSTKLFG